MTGKHAEDLPTHKRRCGDGVAYLWYFDQPTEVGFEWTGRYDDPIEVSQGGFGEPITNLIEFTVNGHRPLIPGPQATLVGFFERTCVEWLSQITLPGSWAHEPRMVREVR